MSLINSLVNQLQLVENAGGLIYAAILYGVGLIVFIYYETTKQTPELRRLPQLDGVEEMVRVCAETNRPFLHTIGQSQDWSLIYVICAAQLLKHCAKIGGPLKVRLLVTGMVPAYVVLCSDFIRQGYVEGGHPELYRADDAVYMEGLGSYVAGTTAMLSRLNCGGLAMYGWIHSAAGMQMSDVAYRTGALQFSALGGWEQNLGAATADYWVIGPEMRQMATYVGGSQTETVTLACEDYVRWAYQALYFVGTILFWLGVGT
jgi:hypothetical protein